MEEDRESWIPYILLFAVLAAPSFFTFTSPSVSDDEMLQMLVDDYVTRLVVIVIICVVPALRAAVRSAFGPIARPEPPLVWLKLSIIIAICLVANVAIESFVRLPLLDVLPDISTYHYPKIDHVLLAWTDLTLGLVLTAFSEEFLYRVFLRRIIEWFTKNVIVIIVLSSVIFSLIHWSHGIPNVISAFLSGMIMMALYVRTGSIMPSIITHYLVNLWHFFPYYTN